MDFEMDKLDNEYTLRTLEILKLRIQKLSNGQKTQLNEAILITMAKFLHEQDFNPERYLSSEFNG